jgi:hypothetical protein
MSNKKFRRPAPEQKPDPANEFVNINRPSWYQAAQAGTPKAEAPKAEAPKAEAPKSEAPKAEPPEAEPPKPEPEQPEAEDEFAEHYANNAAHLKHRLRLLPWRADAREGLSGAYMSRLLQDAAACMHTIVSMTTNVLGTVEVSELRKIFVPEAGFSAELAKDLSAQGVDVKAYEPKPEQKPEGDHRKRPRGAVHPLLQLLKLCVQAAKLLKQIATGTYPEAFNVETPEQKLQRAQYAADSVIWRE